MKIILLYIGSILYLYIRFAIVNGAFSFSTYVWESDQKDETFAPGKPVGTVFRSSDKTECAILNE